MINFINNNKGSSAIEFALVLIPLLLFVFGSIEFGMAIFNKQIITNSARESARFGITARSGRCSIEDITAIENIAKIYADEYLVTFDSFNNIVFDPPITCLDKDGNVGNSFGDELTVSIKYSYDFLFLSSIGIDHLVINSVAKMKFE